MSIWFEWKNLDGIFNIQLITVNYSGLRQRGPKSCTGLSITNKLEGWKKKITNTRVIDFVSLNHKKNPLKHMYIWWSLQYPCLNLSIVCMLLRKLQCFFLNF